MRNKTVSVLSGAAGIILAGAIYTQVEKFPEYAIHASQYVKFLLLVLTIAMVMSLKYVGFYVAAAVYMAVLAPLLGLRRPVLLLVCTVLLLAVIYGVFVRFLGVPVPLGVFEEFTFTDIAGSLAKAKAAWALL